MATIDLSVSVDVSELDAMILRLAGVEAVIATYAALIEAKAKQLAPVKTGALRDEIHTELTAMAADIISDMPYSAVQEYGSGRIPAHPYIRPAAEAYRADFIAALQAVLGV